MFIASGLYFYGLCLCGIKAHNLKGAKKISYICLYNAQSVLNISFDLAFVFISQKGFSSKPLKCNDFIPFHPLDTHNLTNLISQL